jgi:hypothetical protein
MVNYDLGSVLTADIRQGQTFGLVVITGVAVEKLAEFDFAEIASRQEAPQTIFPSLLDIFYHRIFDYLQKDWLFQQPPDLSTSIRQSSQCGLECVSHIWSPLEPASPSAFAPCRTWKSRPTTM